MASKAPNEFVFWVIFEEREDGGLRARCPIVPNFLLSHSDPELVRRDVEPALSTILSEWYGMPMKVRRVPELTEALDHEIPSQHVCAKQSYLGQIEAH
jgi:hypothetical protein